jgi:hypothetical protein
VAQDDNAFEAGDKNFEQVAAFAERWTLFRVDMGRSVLRPYMFREFEAGAG